MSKNISLSILDAASKEEAILNFKNSSLNIKNIYDDAFDYMIHFDIMDNKFVNNVGTDLEYIKIAKKYGIFSDVHLMVERPIEDEYIKKAIEYGANRISVHYEIKNFEYVLDYLNTLDVEVGIAIKPGTDVKKIEEYIGKFSSLLIMSVEPGFGGQEYILKVNEKINYWLEKHKDIPVQVDGGVNFETIKVPLELGVTSFVVGSYLTKSIDMSSRYIGLSIEKEILENKRNDNLEFTKNTLQIVENGYAKDDILLGVKTPDMRIIAKKWYKYIDLRIIKIFLNSEIHEFRQFAIFSITYMKDKNDEIYRFMKENIHSINNWDLTDIAGPNIFAKYLITMDDNFSRNQIQEFMENDDVWIKRIGIVILLEYVKIGKLEFVFDNIKTVLYEKYHLFQKASGWVLRELYKKDKVVTFKFLYKYQKRKKLPSILLSYACEKMTKEEKEKLRGVK